MVTAAAADGRPCQPLVVLASLVDKLPNLAGLARTCEVLAAESLVRRAAQPRGGHGPLAGVEGDAS
jgi:hypothetical protein